MGRKSKKQGRKPHPTGGVPSPAPVPSNADWEDCTASFRGEADSALRSLSCGAAERLAERHPGSPLAHHVLGHVRAALARADEAVTPLRRAAVLAPRCPEIAAALATALSYARRFREALAECARALAVDDPTDPALHSAAACRGGHLMAPSSQARVAVAREQLRGVRADAEALMAASHAATTTTTTPPTTTTPASSRQTTAILTDDQLHSLLAVRVEDLTAAYRDQTASARALAGAVEFARATNAWAYWLCPVCDRVFIDASSFTSHVEREYIHEFQQLQPLMPRRIAKNTEELLDSCRWKPIVEEEEDKARTRNLNGIKDTLSCLNEFKALPVDLVDKLVKFARARAKKRAARSRMPHCVPCCVASLDSAELQRLHGSLEQLLHPFYRDVELPEYMKAFGDTGKSKDDFRVISLVDDGKILSLDIEKMASRNGDGDGEADAVFKWLSCATSSPEEHADAVSWASMRQKCVHHGNEVLKRIDEITDFLQEKFSLKRQLQGKLQRDCLITEADVIDVEMLRMDAEVECLKKKFVKACKFDYSAVMLPLIKAYLWAKLNDSSPGEDFRDGDYKDADENFGKLGDCSDALHDGSFVVQERTSDTDSSDLNHQIIRTECEKSSLRLSDSSNLSTSEAGSISINSGVFLHAVC